jgi:polyhydroxyalkanoic acid synthase PhaR subunit
MTKGVWNVPEDGTPQSSTDLTSLWRQWGETTSKTWSDALEAGKEQYQAKLTPLGMLNPRDVWKLWFDASVGVWRKAAESGGDPLGFITMWLRLMEETQAKISSGEALPTNLFAFYKQWYDATSDTWARLVENTIGSEKFLELVRPFLESYASFLKTFRNAEEEYLKNLQIPTRSDIAHLAELVIALEEKLDQVDDAFEEGLTQVATLESIAKLDEHLNQAESKLDPLPTVLDKVRAIETTTQRLGQVESKLNTLPTVLEKLGEIERLAQRMDQVESKLNDVLATLGKLATQLSTTAEETRPSSTTHSKASPKKTGQQEVKNPEANAGAE